ncbi:SDR family NAD(P)-dependent oxidoreductase [Methyloligella solikamskensis]|uniref:SDR family NAD(P)-dependent oxidoreductase n=1 Tax=Methyloligella solikamskensis TaxID=1177756 RepID=A0ABW3J872_9HYPH
MTTTTLEGRTALVTGAASGIGKAIAEALADAGAQVVGLDLKAGDSVVPILACDVSSETEVASAIGQAAETLGRFDILVNCAGVGKPSRLEDLETDDLDRLLSVNLRGPILVTKTALNHLPRGARIINVSSELAFLGRAGASVYSATKGALVSLTRSWARELAPDILVNAVAPGPIDTPLLEFETMSADAKALETANPLGRIGTPEEVAAVVVFLAGEGASYMTGQCVGVDGGATMR